MQYIRGFSIFIFLSTLFLAPFVAMSSASAKEIRYKEMALDVKPADHMVISCFHCVVHLTQSPQGRVASLTAKKFTSAKAASEDLAKLQSLSFTVRREGTAVIIESKNPDSKSAWADLLKSPGPVLSFDVQAPSVPVEILERDGQISLVNWHQPAALFAVTGSIHTSGTEGALKIQLQRGDIHVEKHRGPVIIDTYSAKLAVHDVEGDLDLTNFAGESSLSGIHGHIGTQTHIGSLALAKSSGAIEFLNGRGNLNLQGFEGPIHGETDQGTVIAKIEGETEVNIGSTQGAVTIHLPAKSGASVRLESDEGMLLAPEAIHIVNGSARRVGSGRLAGTGPKGIVSVKSKSGAIRIRY